MKKRIVKVVNKKKYKTSAYYKNIADNYNSIDEHVSRELKYIYDEIYKAASVGQYSINYNAINIYTLGEKYFDEVVHKLNINGFKTSVVSSNLYYNANLCISNYKHDNYIYLFISWE